MWRGRIPLLPSSTRCGGLSNGLHLLPGSGLLADHERARHLSRQITENTINNAKFRPALKAIVEHLVRAIGLGRTLPLKAVLQNVDDAGNDTTIIYSGYSVRLGEEGLNLRHLIGLQKK